MKLADIRLVAVDEDGTFVRPDYTFDRPRFARIWQRMEELGIRFAVATGNQHHQVREVFAPEYVEHIGVVAQDGTYVADGLTEVHVSEMDHALVTDIVGVLRELSALVQFCGVRGGYLERDPRLDQQWMDESFALINTFYTQLEWTDDVLALDDRATMICTLVESEERADEVAPLIEQRLDGRVTARPSGDGCIDVLPPGCSKAAGLQHLAQRWGIEPAQVVAFGNAYNDIEMIEWAGMGVMMANAPDELKARAELIAPPCSEDGVLTVLEELLF